MKYAKYFKTAESKGENFHKDRKSHIFELEIQNEKSWLIFNEYDKEKLNYTASLIAIRY